MFRRRQLMFQAEVKDAGARKSLHTLIELQYGARRVALTYVTNKQTVRIVIV